MTTFLFILACIIWFLALIAAGGGAIVYAVHLVMEHDGYRKAAATIAGGIVTVAFIAWLGVATGLVTTDNAKHCGPGTTYRESSRYDPATKTVRTDWVCEANR